MKRLTLRTCALLAVGFLLSACAAARPRESLIEQAESARTPDEHRAVATGYRAYSERLRAEAVKHVSLAERWSNPARAWQRRAILITSRHR